MFTEMTYLPKDYEVAEIVDYTDDVKLFRVKCDLHPQPGQFIEVSVGGVGECPLASCACDDDHLDILTKNAGNVTSAIFNVKVGETLSVRGPYGKGFPLKELKGKNLILVAGGTGIAPITSLIDYIEKNRGDFGEVFIYFGFRDEENILLKDRIEKWEKLFKVFVGLSDDPDSHDCEKGFIQDIMEKHKPVVENTVALLCGPEIMMDCVTKKLKGLGIGDDKIYWSMERRMECGFGSCGRCQIQDLYVCKDGPIFRWDVIKPRLDNENSAREEKK